jgi:hypothetical protein
MAKIASIYYLPKPPPLLLIIIIQNGHQQQKQQRGELKQKKISWLLAVMLAAG